jgi:toxin ParE1/3/4
LIVQLSNRARAEFERALAYLQAESPRAADYLRERIEAAVASLQELPNRGRPGPADGTRELLVRKTPYVIVYAVTDERVLIVRIRHASQDPSP